MNKFLKSSTYFLAICFVILSSSGVRAETSSPDYSVTQETENSTEFEANSDSYNIKGEVGNSVSGESTSSNYVIQHGTIWVTEDDTTDDTSDDTTDDSEDEEEDNPEDGGGLIAFILGLLSGDDDTPEEEPVVDDNDDQDNQDQDTNDNEKNDTGEETQNQQDNEETNPESESESEDTPSQEQKQEQEQDLGEADDNNQEESNQDDLDNNYQEADNNQLGGVGKIISRIGNLGLIQSLREGASSLLNKIKETLVATGGQSQEDYLVISQDFKKIVEYADEIATSEQAQTTNAVTATTFSALSIVYIASQVDSVSQIPYAIFNLFGIFSWRRRRQKKQGRVYDVKTGQPVPFAKITIYDEFGTARETKISDKFGNYFFLVPEGKYHLGIQKKGYKLIDEADITNKHTIYSSLYTGKKELNFDKDGMVVQSLPLILSQQKKNRFGIFSKTILYSVLNIIFYIGLVVSSFIAVHNPSFYNIIVLAVYLFLYLLRVVNIAQPHWGKVFSKKGIAQAFSSISVFDENYPEKMVARAVTDEKGRFAFILDKGDYNLDVVTIDRQEVKEKIHVKKRSIVAKDIQV